MDRAAQSRRVDSRESRACDRDVRQSLDAHDLLFAAARKKAPATMLRHRGFATTARTDSARGRDGSVAAATFRSIGGWSISCSISFASCRRLPLDLPMPRDTRALRVAIRIRDDPGERATLATLAKAAGASHRTLERLFQADTAHDAGAMASASAIAPGGATYSRAVRA